MFGLLENARFRDLRWTNERWCVDWSLALALSLHLGPNPFVYSLRPSHARRTEAILIRSASGDGSMALVRQPG